jgi:hypothetical protein
LQHAQILWACDFFSKNVWTLNGLVECFIFFVIHVGSRRVHVVGMTPHPDRAWMAQHARNLSMHFAEALLPPGCLNGFSQFCEFSKPSSRCSRRCRPDAPSRSGPRSSPDRPVSARVDCRPGPNRSRSHHSGSSAGLPSSQSSGRGAMRRVTSSCPVFAVPSLIPTRATPPHPP